MYRDICQTDDSMFVSTDGTMEDDFVDDFANADNMNINEMPEPPELPPPLFPGPSQTVRVPD